MSRLIRIAIVIGGSVAALACSNALAPFQPEITNSTDNFQAQATGVTGVTTTRVFTWQNTGTTATVNHSTTLTAGAAHLTIKDAANTVVYDHDLVPSLNEPTAAGVAGAWTITMQLTGYSGTLNFRVQSP